MKKLKLSLEDPVMGLRECGSKRDPQGVRNGVPARRWPRPSRPTPSNPSGHARRDEGRKQRCTKFLQVTLGPEGCEVRNPTTKPPQGGG